MAKQWVLNTASGPRHVGGALLQPGEGAYVDDGPLDATPTAVPIVAVEITYSAYVARAVPLPPNTLLVDPETRAVYGQTNADGGVTGFNYIAISADQFAGLVAASHLSVGTTYRVGTPEVCFRATSANTATLQPSANNIAWPKVPPVLGMSWLTDTINAFDIYKFAVQTPTAFFDPSATTSMNRGTLLHPYNTQAALETVFTGDCRGQVLGFKRGTTLRVTSDGLILRPYGTADHPFLICPYGDAEALPIVSGAEIVTTWTLVDAPTNIWSYAVGALRMDAYEDGIRLISKTFSVSAVATLTTPGTSTYSSSTLYVRPYSGGSPNLGTMEVAKETSAALNLKHANVSAAGYVTVAGIHVRTSRNNVLAINGETGAMDNITTIAGVHIYGCKAGQGGTDYTASGLGGDAIMVYGVYNGSSVVRMTDSSIEGNYLYDCTNNSIEITACDGALVQFNQSDRCSGHSVVEFWAENNDCIARYNIGNRSTKVDRLATDLSCSGVWFGNYSYAAGAFSTLDATNLKNADNSAVFNLIMTPGKTGRFLFANGGTGHTFQHNTCYYNPVDDGDNASSGCSGIVTSVGGAAADVGFVDISNNLFYWDGLPSSTAVAVQITGASYAAASAPVGNNNYYVHAKGSSANYVTPTYTGTGLTSYKAALATATVAFDQDSNASGGSGATLGNSVATVATNLAFDVDTKRLGAAGTASVAGLTTLTTIGNKYGDGVPYTPATATIGAFAKNS